MMEAMAAILHVLGSSAFASLLVSALIAICIGLVFLISGAPFGRRGTWVWHPESPGMRVWVVRGFWGRVFKPADWATLAEASEYTGRRI